MLFAGCLSMFPSGSTTTVPGRTASTDLATTTVTGPLTMWAQPITVEYQPSDLKYFTVSDSTVSSAAATGQASISTVTATSTPPSTSTPHLSQSMSGGAKIGIAIGCIVAAAIIGVAIYFFLPRRRKSTHPVTHHVKEQQQYYAGEEYSNIPWAQNHRQELAELSGEPRIQKPSELPGDPQV
jgi:hypothetical protein